MRIKNYPLACLLFGLAIVFVSAVHAQEVQDIAPKPLRMAFQIHRSAPVVDGHNDLPWALRQTEKGLADFDLRQQVNEFHTDIPRLRAGGVGAQFWSVYVPVSTIRGGSALSTTLEQIDLVKEIVKQYPEVFELALSTDDIARIREEGKIASMIGVEGGHSIENSLSVLRQLYQQGARYMTLTHSQSLDWADSCSDQGTAGGLSDFGEEVVREMNRLGMLIDLSHVSVECMRDALRVTQAPVIFSHSSAFAIAPHPRNVPDEILRQTKQNGGVVMVNFFNDFIHPADTKRSLARYAERDRLAAEYPDDQEQVESQLSKWEVANPRSKLCTIEHVLDHIDHIVKVAGIDHVGLGSDFDGVPVLPNRLDDVAAYPLITAGLLTRGYDEQQVRKILGGNVIRAFRQAEQVAEGL